jgi:hypothetical protein
MELKEVYYIIIYGALVDKQMQLEKELFAIKETIKYLQNERDLIKESKIDRK